MRFLLLSVFFLSAVNFADEATPADPVAESERCLVGLTATGLRPGWTLERRRFACRSAGAQCVLTLARLRPNWNEVLLNEECRDDYANCAGNLARRLTRGYYRGHLRSFCLDTDLACVVRTEREHPTWHATDIHDYCLNPAEAKKTGEGYGIWGIREGSRDAVGLLKAVNLTATAQLARETLLSRYVTGAIGRYRGDFVSVSEFVIHTKISKAEMGRVLDYARRNGFIYP